MADRVENTGGAQSAPKSLPGKTVIDLGELLAADLENYGIRLFVNNDKGVQDDNASIKNINSFFEQEGIEPSEESVKDFSDWLKKNAKVLTLCKRLSEETGISLLTLSDGTSVVKESQKLLLSLIAECFPGSSEANLEENVNRLIDLYKRYVEGVFLFAYSNQAPELKRPLTDTETADYDMKIARLEAAGIRLSVTDENGIDDFNKTYARLEYFLKQLGINAKEKFDSFIAFYEMLVGESPVEKADALKKLPEAEKVALSKATFEQEDASVSFLVIPFSKVKAVNDLTGIGDKVIVRGWELLVFQKTTLKTEAGKSVQVKETTYYWLTPKPKYEIIPVSNQEKAIIEGELIAGKLKGALLGGRDAEVATTYGSLIGAKPQSLVLYQTRALGIKPQTIRTLRDRLREGKEIKEIIKEFNDLKPEQEKAMKAYEAAEDQAKGAKARFESAVKQYQSSAEDAKRGVTSSRESMIKRRIEARDKQREAKPAFDKFNLSVKEAKAVQEKVKAKVDVICKEFGIDEADLDKVIGFLEGFESIYQNDSKLNLDQISDALEEEIEFSGTSLTEAGSLVAIVDQDVFRGLNPEKPKVGEVEVKSGHKRITVKTDYMALKEPILLIKLPLAKDYKVDPKEISLTREDLLAVAAHYSPRYLIQGLGFPPAKEDQPNLQLQAENAIRLKMNTQSGLLDSDRSILEKLLGSLKGNTEINYSRSEFERLRAVMLQFQSELMDKDTGFIWKTLYERIFSKENEYRIGYGRGGLTPETQALILEFAKSGGSLLTTMPESGDDLKTMQVKTALRDLAFVLGDSLQKVDFQDYDDSKPWWKNLWSWAGDLAVFTSEQMKEAGKVTQNIQLPNGVEDHLWFFFRWDQMEIEGLSRKDFTEAKEGFEKAKKTFKEKDEEFTIFQLKHKDFGGDEKARGELKKETEALQKELGGAKEALFAAQEKFLQTMRKYRLDGTVNRNDVEAILNLRGGLEFIFPLLDNLMMDGSGNRVNRINGEEIDTIEKLKAFILGQIGKDGWKSLLRDPGEDIKTVIAKKLVALILAQNYFSRSGQWGIFMSLASFVPVANYTKMGATVLLGAAGYTLNNVVDGVPLKDATQLPEWMSQLPLLREVGNIMRSIQPRASANVAPYVHLLFGMLGSEYQFHLYDQIINGKLEVVAKDQLKTFFDLAVKSFGGLNEGAIRLIDEKISKTPYDKLPKVQRELWDKIKAKQLNWEDYEKLFTSDSMQLWSNTDIGKKIFDLAQLIIFVVSVEGETLATSKSVAPGGHIGKAEIDAALENGLVYMPSNLRQVPSSVLGIRRGISATDAGYADHPIHFDTEGGYLDVIRANLDWPLVSLGSFASASVHTIGTYSFMPQQFFNMGVQYTSDLVEALKVNPFDDPAKLYEVGKSLAGLLAGVMVWGTFPTPFAGDALQHWDEKNYAASLGSLAATAKFFIDVLRLDYYRLLETRRFMMDRPSQLKMPITFFNAIPYAVTEPFFRAAKWGINKAWDPDSRTSGDSWLSRKLLGVDKVHEGVSSWWMTEKAKFFGEGLTPTLNNQNRMFWNAVGTRYFVNGLVGGVYGMEYIQRMHAWAGRNRYLGYDRAELGELNRALRRMDENLNTLKARLSTTEKMASFLKTHGVTADKVSFSQGTLLRFEFHGDGKVGYINGNTEFFAEAGIKLESLSPEARAVIFPTRVLVTLKAPASSDPNAPVFEKPYWAPVKEVRVVSGNETEVAIYEDKGGQKYACLTIGDGLLKDRLITPESPKSIDFTAAIERLNAAQGTIYEGVEPTFASPKYSDERLIEVKGEIEETAKNVDELWKQVFRLEANPVKGKKPLKEISDADLSSISRAADRSNLDPKFEELTFDEQNRAMSEKMVTFKIADGTPGGKEITCTYLEARMLWVRAMVQRHSVDSSTGERTRIELTTPQINGVLAMHLGFSAEIYTGEGKTVDHCALNLLDAVTGRKLISVTHNDLTAEANYNEMKTVYDAAGISVKFVRHTDAGIREVFGKHAGKGSKGSQVIYLAMSDLAFINLGNKTSGEKPVEIPWEQGLFRVDEFDFIYMTDNPYIMSGGEVGRAEVKAWRNAWKSIKSWESIRKAEIGRDFVKGEDGTWKLTDACINNPKRTFLNEKGEAVRWNRLSSSQQRKIMRLIQARFMKINEEFSINRIKGEVIVESKDTGTHASGVTLSDGLSQALETIYEGKIGLGTIIHPESATMAQVMSKTMIRNIRHMVASSGTLTQIKYVLDKVGIQFIPFETNVPRYTWNSYNTPEFEASHGNIKFTSNEAAVLYILNRAEEQIRIGKTDLQIRGKIDDKTEIDDLREKVRQRYENAEADQSKKAPSLEVFLEHPVEMPSLTGDLEKDYKAKVKLLVEKAKVDLSQGKVIVINVSSPTLAKDVYEALLKDADLMKEAKKSFEANKNNKGKKFKKSNIGLMGPGNEGDYQRVFSAKIDSQYAILVTTMAGRATDLRFNKGTKTVQYMADQQEGSWGFWQRIGRLGRQGASAEIRFFSSPDCAIFGAPIEFNEILSISERTGIELQEFAGAKTYQEVLMVIGRNNADFTSELHEEAEVDARKALYDKLYQEFFEKAQEGFDKLSFERWTDGARGENLLEAGVKARMEALDKAFGGGGTKAEIKEKCRLIVQEELHFMWNLSGQSTDAIVDFSGADREVQRQKVADMIKILENLFGVKIKLDIPNSGKYRFSDIAEAISKKAVNDLFDLSKIENRELREIILRAFLSFRQNVKVAEEELVKQYHSEGKLVASSDLKVDQPDEERKKEVREKFVLEYRERVENLYEQFRRNVVVLLRAEQRRVAAPVFGSHASIGRGTALIKLQSEDIFKPIDGVPEAQEKPSHVVDQVEMLVRGREFLGLSRSDRQGRYTLISTLELREAGVQEKVEIIDGKVSVSLYNAEGKQITPDEAIDLVMRSPEPHTDGPTRRARVGVRPSDPRGSRPLREVSLERSAQVETPVAPKPVQAQAPIDRAPSKTGQPVDVQISLPEIQTMDGAEKLATELSKYDPSASVRLTSKQVFRVSTGRKALTAWMMAEKIVETKLLDANVIALNGEVVDELGQMEVLEAFSILPEAENIPKSHKKAYSLVLSSGRTLEIYAHSQSGEVVLSITGDDARSPIKLVLSAKEMKALKAGRAALSEIVMAAEKKNAKEGVDRATIMARVSEAKEKIKTIILKASKDKLLFDFDLPVFETTGTRAELEADLLSYEFEVKLGKGESVPVKIKVTDLRSLLAFKEGTPERKTALENIKQAILEAVGKPGNEDIVESDIDKAIKDVSEKAKQASIKATGQSVGEQIAQTKALEVLNLELSKIDPTKMTAKQIDRAVAKARKKAADVYTLTASKAYQRLMARAQELDVTSLTEAQVRSLYEQAAKETGVEIDKLDQAQLDAEVKRVTENFNLDPNREGLSTKERVLALAEYYQLNAPGGSLSIKAKAFGRNVGKMALMGMVLDLPFAAFRQMRATGKVDPSQLLIDVINSGYGWGKFEAVSRSFQVLQGLEQRAASHLAIGLIQLWAVADAAPEERGVVMTSSGLGLAGFLGASGLAGLAIKNITKLNKNPIGRLVGEGLVAGAGIFGSELTGLGFELTMKVPEIETVVRSEAFNIAGNAVAVVAPGLNAKVATSLAQSIISRIALKLGEGGIKTALTSTGTYLLPALGFGYAFFGTLLTPSVANANELRLEGDLFGFANGRDYRVREQGQEFANNIKAIAPDSNFYVEDLLSFELAVYLRKNGFMPDLKLEGARGAEINDLLHVLDTVDFSAPKETGEEAVKRGLSRYSAILQDKRTKSGYEMTFKLAKQKLIDLALAEGLAEKDPAVIYKGYKGDTQEYIQYKVSEEKTRHAEFIGAQQEAAEKAAIELAGIRDREKGWESAELAKNLAVVENAASSVFRVDKNTAHRAALILVSTKLGAKQKLEQVRAILPYADSIELERFVTNVDLKNRAFNSELKLEAAKLVKQGGGFKAYLETQGYFDYLKKNGVAEDKYGEYLVGERFKKTYVDFMLKQVYRASMKKNVIDAVLATVIFDPAQHTMSEEMKAAYNAYLQLNPKGDLESFAEYYLDQLWQDNSAAIIKDLEKQLLQPDVHFRIGGLIEEEKAGFMKYLAGKYPRYTAGEPAMVDVSANRVPRMVPLKSVITPEMAYLLITGQLTLKKKP